MQPLESTARRSRPVLLRLAEDSPEVMPFERWTEARSIITGWLIQEYRRRHGLESKQINTANP
jgi:hypothetical protein